MTPQEHGALIGLPQAFHALIPELDTIRWPAEEASTCGDCVMARPHAHREVFLADVRCCSFFPRLHNYSVGRILQRGEVGAKAVRALLQGGADIVPLGIEPTEEWLRQYTEHGPDGFGHVRSLRCPYWAEGDLACGIWQDRNQVCRTWFCKHDEGSLGQDLWEGLRDTLTRAGRMVADALVAGGDPPHDDADPAVWEAWFLDCAERLPNLAIEDMAQDPHLLDKRKTLQEADARRNPSLPDVLGANLTKWQVTPEGGWLYSYSPYDELAVPGDIWQLLSRLDGERTWQQAQAEARTAGFEFEESLVRELFRIGAVEPRVPGDAEPGLARVKLQGSDGKWKHMGLVELQRGG
jgi:hypothetical protein